MFIVVLITCANKAQAQKIAQALIKARLAACVNLVNPVNSLFWWQGKVDSSKETLLIIKTKKNLFSRLEKLVKSLHSYDVAEIIALPIVKGSRKYLSWINESTR
ncbi:MAG TPA: divalent-cation tolerance protein CutA [Candidatus Omnitrophota bacterium]|nr:divalent-cation tolerance protein CutA [Candidatus Omnitrophota bacterium]